MAEEQEKDETKWTATHLDAHVQMLAHNFPLSCRVNKWRG